MSATYNYLEVSNVLLQQNEFVDRNLHLLRDQSLPTVFFTVLNNVVGR